MAAKTNKDTSGEQPIDRTIDKTVEIQTALRALGYECAIDGEFGPVTKNAVKRFQSSKRIRVDGIVDDKTYSLLSK